jgi:tetratricopeptide (TPR) repeat protein
MRRLVVLLPVLIIMLASAARPESIHTLILKGRLDEARDSLSRLATAATRDGSILYYQSLLEADAAQAVRLMEAALSAGLPSQYREEISYRLAQYYLLRKDYRKLSELLAEYHSLWERGRYRAEMMRLSILTDELNKAYESALRQCDRYLVDNSDGDLQQWGLIDKARILDANGKPIGANETVRQLSRSKKGVGVSPSLYLLGMQAIAKNRTDDAIFYYNVLREACPSAVGLDQMLAGLGHMTARSRPDNQAEKLTGTYYSVKVGVFSDPDNARKQAALFKGYDHNVDIETKKISGRNYRVVYIGRFQDYDEADRFRLQLEAAHHEAFQVVAR